MSAKRLRAEATTKLRTEAAAKREVASPGRQPIAAPSVEPSFSPPRPSRWQLAVSSFLVAVWMIFLAWMAFGS